MSSPGANRPLLQGISDERRDAQKTGYPVAPEPTNSVDPNPQSPLATHYASTKAKNDAEKERKNAQSVAEPPKEETATS